MNRGTGFIAQRSRLALVKKGVQRVEELDVVREGSTGRVVSMLPRVWAVADVAAAPCKALPLGDDVDSEVGAHRARLNSSPDMAFYRKYTEALLRRYLKQSMASGRSGSLLGREMFRSVTSHLSVDGFDDSVIFCVDVEHCLAKLQPLELALVKRIAVQEYSQGEAASVLGLSLRACIRRYNGALDRLTGILLEAGILEPLKSCQEGRVVLVGLKQ